MLNQPTITPAILKSMSGAVAKILYTSHPSDVADCAQDACVRVLSSLASFDATRGDFAGWCHVIARNVAKNWRKASANRGHDSEGHADEDGERAILVDTLIGSDGRVELARSADAQALTVALDALDSDDRAFIDALMDGMGQTEAGAILGWSAAGTTRRRRVIEAKLAAAMG
jgi:RNA polymerase sigma factor (sigma-70 family)